MNKRKHTLPSPDLLYILVGLLVVLIVVIPIGQWAIPAMFVDVCLLFYAILRSSHTLQ